MCDHNQLEEVSKIEPTAIFGFDGKVDYGLRVHPDKQHIIFPLGSKIGITTLLSNKQEFLSGHTSNVSCLDVSSTGNLFASGQINLMGFRAYVIMWDWKTKKEIARHDLHKVRVQSICFTAQDLYLVSLGGQDDDTIIVYDVETQTPICRSIASKATSGFAFKLCRLHNTSSVFIVGGDKHLRIWSVQREQKKLAVQDISVGRLQRRYTGMRVDANDGILYLGTMTGDIVKVRLNCCDPVNVTKNESVAVLMGSYGRYIPNRPKGKDCEKYVNGIRDLYILDSKRLLIGDGEGTLEVVEERDVSFKDYPGPTWPKLKTISRTKVNGAVSSISLLKKGVFLVGTDNSEIYLLSINSGMDLKLLSTCHKAKVYDICFPKNFSLVFATASYESIRIWSTTRMKELLRIMVYNFSCASIQFAHDGTSIISAWNDGILRAFTPMQGRLIYAIPNAHNKGCSAVTISSNGKVLVSGGIEGQVRVWKIEPLRQSLVGVLKEHSAPITTVDFNKFDTEVVSASNDGSCVIWDINRLTRKHVLYANTQFMCARYYPTGVQILASGSDRRISFWEAYDGSLVRELEGSADGSVNSVSINHSGEYFVSVGNDQLVKLWDYQKGITICCGTTHASAAICCRFAPNGKFFVTGSADGAIMIWDVPKEYWPTDVDPLATAPVVARTPPRIDSAKLSEGRKSVKNENIEQLETSRINKDVLCAECPAVDKKAMPDINEICNVIPED